MTSADPKFADEIDSDVDITVGGTDGSSGGVRPMGGPYKPVSEPVDDPLVTPMGGPYKPVSEPVDAFAPVLDLTGEPSADAGDAPVGESAGVVAGESGERPHKLGNGPVVTPMGGPYKPVSDEPVASVN